MSEALKNYFTSGDSRFSALSEVNKAEYDLGEPSTRDGLMDRRYVSAEIARKLGRDPNESDDIFDNFESYAQAMDMPTDPTKAYQQVAQHYQGLQGKRIKKGFQPVETTKNVAKSAAGEATNMLFGMGASTFEAAGAAKVGLEAVGGELAEGNMAVATAPIYSKIAKHIGTPVDYITKGLNAAGMNIENPFGGEEFIKKLMNKAGIVTDSQLDEREIAEALSEEFFVQVGDTIRKDKSIWGGWGDWDGYGAENFEKTYGVPDEFANSWIGKGAAIFGSMVALAPAAGLGGGNIALRGLGWGTFLASGWNEAREDYEATALQQSIAEADAKNAELDKFKVQQEQAESLGNTWFKPDRQVELEAELASGEGMDSGEGARTSFTPSKELSDEQRMQSFKLAALYAPISAWLERGFGFEKVVQKYMKREGATLTRKGILKGGAQATVGAGVGGGFEEMSQGFTMDLIAETFYDPERGTFTVEGAKRRAFEFIAGMIGEGAMGGTFGVAGEFDLRRKTINSLTANDGTPFGFQEMTGGLRKVRTDEELIAMGAELDIGDSVLNAANGDRDAYDAYREAILENTPEIEVIAGDHTVTRDLIFNYKGKTFINSDYGTVEFDPENKNHVELQKDLQSHTANLQALRDAQRGERTRAPRGTYAVPLTVFLPSSSGGGKVPVGRVEAPQQKAVDGKYVVISPETNEPIGEFDTKTEANAAAWKWQEEQLSSPEVHESTRSTVGNLLRHNQGQKVEYFKAKTFGQMVRDGEMTEAQAIARVKESEGGITDEQAKELLDQREPAGSSRVVLKGFDMLTWIAQPVAGEQMELSTPDRIGRYVVLGASNQETERKLSIGLNRIAYGASLYAPIEEFSESYLKLLSVADGAKYGTLSPAVRTMVVNWRKALNEELTPAQQKVMEEGYDFSDSGLIEWFSSRAIDYSNSSYAGDAEQRFRESMPEEIRGFMSLVRRFAKVLWDKAELMLHLRETGKLPESMEGSIREVLGMPTNYTRMDIEQLDRAGYEIIQEPLAAGSTGETFQTTENARDKAFYSQLERTLEAKIQGKSATVQQVKGLLDPKHGIKAEEIKWSGIEQWLDDNADAKGKVQTADLMAYLRDAGRVKFEEVSRGGGEVYNIDFESEQAVRDYTFGDDQLESSDGVLKEGLEIRQLPSGRWNLFDPKHPDSETKYASYVLPNGENYREVVLTMPVKDSAASGTITFKDETELDDYLTDISAEGYEAFNYGVLDDGLTVEFNDLPANIYADFVKLSGQYNSMFKLSKGYKNPSYTSSHFSDIPNYVAHMRLNERQDSEGNDGLFIEEIQSDRHQQGREKGYKEERPIEADPYKLVYDGDKVQLVYRDSMILDTGSLESSTDEAVLTTKAQRLNAEHRSEQSKLGIPDAPFRKDWNLQMFKRALRDAVASGKDWIGWTTGETQAERYDLSKQINEIQVESFTDEVNGATRMASVSMVGGVAHDLHISPDGIVTEAGAGLGEAEGKPLSDVLGKEVAQKIMDVPAGESSELSGLDLKVGGEGMKGFYDNMLPKAVQKYVKKWGAKVERGAIGRTRTEYVEEAGEWLVKDGGEYLEHGDFKDGARFAEEGLDPNTIARFLSKSDAEEATLEIFPSRPDDFTPIHRVTITDAMRESVQQGQPTYQVTQTPEFKAWFSGSKVVDENGEPLVVYHGTQANIESFKLQGEPFTFTNLSGKQRTSIGESGFGFWFAPSADKIRAGHHFGKSSPKGVIYPVYLSVKNPLVIDDDTRGIWENSVESKDFPLLISKEAMQEVKAEGHDGIFYLDKGKVWDGNTESLDEIIAFDPTQIKSATGNRGTFDPTDPRITYQVVDAMHWSNVEGLDFLDPARHGEGISGIDLKRRKAHPDIYVPRVYVGIDPYQKEPRLPDNVYKMKVDTDILYDVNDDPELLMHQAAVGSRSAWETFTRFEALVKGRGYLGILNDTTGVVAIFHKVPTNTKLTKAWWEKESGKALEPKVIFSKKAFAANAADEIARVKDTPFIEENGATFNADGTPYTGGGIVVGIASADVFIPSMTPEGQASFAARHAIKLKHSLAKTGNYKFPKSNQGSYDMSIVVPADMQDEALELAKHLRQESIYNMDTGENVKTGFDGKDPRTVSDQEFFELANRFETEGESGTLVEGDIDGDTLADLIDEPKETNQITEVGGWRTLTPEDLRGKKLFGFYADRMRVGTYTGLDPESGINIKMQGGIDYPISHKGAAWAVSSDSMHSSLANAADSRDGIALVVAYASGNITGNETFADAYIEELKWAIAQKKISKTAALKILNKVRKEAVGNYETARRNKQRKFDEGGGGEGLIARLRKSVRGKKGVLTDKQMEIISDHFNGNQKEVNRIIEGLKEETVPQYVKDWAKDVTKVRLAPWAIQNKTNWKSVEEFFESLTGKGATFDSRGDKMFRTGFDVKGNVSAQKLGARDYVKAGMPDITKMINSMEVESTADIKTGDILGLVQIDKGQAGKPTAAPDIGVDEHRSYSKVLRGKPYGKLPKTVNILDVFDPRGGKLPLAGEVLKYKDEGVIRDLDAIISDEALAEYEGGTNQVVRKEADERAYNAEQEKMDSPYWSEERARHQKFLEQLEFDMPERSFISGSFAKYGMSMGTRLRNINIRLFARVREHRLGIHQRIAKYADQTQPAREIWKQLSKDERLTLGVALANRDDHVNEEALAIYEKYEGLREAIAEVRTMLSNVKRYAVMHGFEVAELDNYWPRWLKDRDLFLTNEFGIKVKGKLDRAVAEVTRKALENNVAIDEEDIMKALSNVMAGLQREGALPSNFKGRTIDYLDPKWFKEYYALPFEAVDRYITQVVEKVERKKFFGKAAVMDESTGTRKLNLASSAAGLVAEIVNNEELNPAEQEELVTVIQALHTKQPMSEFIQKARSIGYITTMAKWEVAMVNFEDITSAVFSGRGLKNIKYFASLFDKDEMSIVRDFGMESIGQDHEDAKMSYAKATDFFMKKSGMQFLGRGGANAQVNSGVRGYKESARNGKFSDTQERRLIEFFGGDLERIQALKEDLKDDVKSDDVILLGWNILLDFQPMDYSEMPEGYAKAGNYRIFYMLKTFTLKRWDIMRREGVREMRLGVEKRDYKLFMGGARKLLWLYMLYLMGGATVDMVRDTISGKEPTVEDSVFANMLKVVGVNRYLYYEFKRVGFLGALGRFVAPPMPYIDYPIRDFMGMLGATKSDSPTRNALFGNNDDWSIGSADSWRLIPFMGGLYDHYYGGSEQRMREKEAKERRRRRRDRN